MLRRLEAANTCGGAINRSQKVIAVALRKNLNKQPASRLRCHTHSLGDEQDFPDCIQIVQADAAGGDAPPRNFFKFQRNINQGKRIEQSQQDQGVSSLISTGFRSTFSFKKLMMSCAW